MLAISSQTTVARIVRALQVKLYSYWPAARVVCFAGLKNFLGGTLTQPRPDDAFKMRQQFGEYFAPNSISSSFGINFPSNLEEKTKKIKKCFHRKTFGYLITVTRSVLLFHRKKAFVVTCFWAIVCWSSCASREVYSRLGDTSSDLGGHSPKCRPLPPFIGVARIFDWRGSQTKNHMQ